MCQKSPIFAIKIIDRMVVILSWVTYAQDIFHKKFKFSVI